MPEITERLPLILAGPVLRRTEADAVTVWLALKEPRQVTLRVYLTEREQVYVEQWLLEGTRTTIHLGQHLHLVAVTAKPIDGSRLEPGKIYAYDLSFDGIDSPLYQALHSKNFPSVTISYFNHNLPTFALPPDDLNQLQIVHGSCRKPHGGDRDAMPMLDNLVETVADLPFSRPHQLFLTGDQIYADDVADPLLWTASQLGDRLLGWEESLPLGDRDAKPTELKPGQRTQIAKDCGGFTAMLHNKPKKAKSHLFSFGEYCALSLLAWSPVLLPEFPEGKTICKNSKQSLQWDKEAHAIQGFARDLWQVRRSLANVPTYTIFDDHDISDDWYLNQEWCNRVLGKPLGRRVVQNGLLAYALFQGWGNTPEQFSGDRPGAKLLRAVEKWSASAGTDEIAWEDIGKYLGMPPVDPQTGLPKLKRDEDVLILDRASDGVYLDWHYTARGSKHEVIVLDTRTWRGYPCGEGEIAPPMLLCPSAFRKQLQDPLEQSRLTQSGTIEATLVVLPTNLVSLSIIDAIQRWNLRQGKVFGNDVGDAWNFHQAAFTKLLEILGQQRDRVVILSGDIHYSGTVRLNYWLRSQDCSSVMAQLTCSALKNAEWTTNLVHTKIKSVFLEQPEYWTGWQKPPQLVEIAVTPNRVRMREAEVPEQGSVWRQLRTARGNRTWQLALKDRQSLPDWQYQIEWVKRQKAQLVPCRKRTVWPAFSQGRMLAVWQKAIRLGSWLWHNRWLQEGEEVIGRNNLGIVTFQWLPEDEDKAVVQEIYWHPPWNPTRTVKSRFVVSLRRDSPLPLPVVEDLAP